MKIIISVLVFLTHVTAQEIELINGDHNFPEGPAWDGQRYLYVSNCYGNWISRISDGKADTLVVQPSSPFSFGNTNGLAVYKNGDIYACDFGLGAIIHFSPSGKCKTLISGYKGIRFNRPNDLAFDNSGNLYFTDPKSYEKSIRDGRLFAYFRDHDRTALVAENLAFPNGLAFSADAKHLFVCESALNRVLKYEVTENGTLGRYIVFINLPGGDPDGIALDIEENVYIAHFGSGTVFVVSPRGKIIREIKIPGKKPTNVEFGSVDMQTLFITEAETNGVYSIRVEVPGLKLLSSP